MDLRGIKKHRVSIRLDKCRFLKSRLEFVGYHILCKANCLEQSKYQMIDDWPIPTLVNHYFLLLD